MNLYTLGYQKRDVPDFVDILLWAGVDLVVDVRETPWSYKPGFSRTALTTALAAVGIEYFHAGFAGNPKAIRRAAKTHDACLAGYREYLERNLEVVAQFDALMLELKEANLVPCFVCYERHPADCHRSLLIESWGTLARQGATIAHLEPFGQPRLSKARRAIPGQLVCATDTTTL